ncbi:MAG TPA: hypothetical protein PLP27_10990 [Crocinitomicaceae bacterium]|nr:hypothetical protein [Crocinitomicaceae bacterium]
MIAIDFIFLISILLPPLLRREELMLYLQAALKPLRQLHDVFQTFYTVKRYELAFNGQVIYLEHLLNDKFNPSATPKIYIEDMTISEPFYLYNDLENAEPVYLWNASEDEEPVYLFNQAEYAVGFIIYVPMGVVTNWNEFRYWVDKYKLKSKEYTIIEY